MKLRPKQLAYGFVAITLLWAVTALLATTAVVGKHPEWRRVWARPQDFGLDAEGASFLSTDGIPLKAWFLSAQPSKGTVILVHGIDGNRSNMLPRAFFLVRGGYDVLDIDLRGHGASGGNYASPGYLEARDILGGVSYLRERGVSTPIVAMGHSYGAVAALWAATQSQEMAAVVADSPYLDLDDMTKRAARLLADDPRRSFWARMGLHLAPMEGAEFAVLPMFYLRTGVWVDLRKTDTLTAIRELGPKPVLLISGGSDAITPPADTRKMYEASRSPDKMLLIVPGADHDTTYRTAPQLYQSTVLRFLRIVFGANPRLVGEQSNAVRMARNRRVE
jgi:uncharacterized protein